MIDQLNSIQLEIANRVLSMSIEVTANIADQMRERFYIQQKGRNGGFEIGNRLLSYEQPQELEIVNTTAMALNEMTHGRVLNRPDITLPDFRMRVIENFTKPIDQVDDSLEQAISLFRDPNYTGSERNTHLERAGHVSYMQMLRDFAQYYPQLTPGLLMIFTSAGAAGTETAISESLNFIEKTIAGELSHRNVHEVMIERHFRGRHTTSDGHKKTMLCSALQGIVNHAETMRMYIGHAAVDLFSNYSNYMEPDESVEDFKVRITLPLYVFKPYDDLVVRAIVHGVYTENGHLYTSYPKEKYDPTSGRSIKEQLDLSRHWE
jgi:hypothetical protein